MHHMDRMKMLNLSEDRSSGLVENALLLNCNIAVLSLVLPACTLAMCVCKSVSGTDFSDQQFGNIKLCL